MKKVRKAKLNIIIMCFLTLALAFLLTKNIVLKANGNGENAPTVQYTTDANTYYDSLEGLKGEKLIEGIATLMDDTHKTYTSYSEIKGGNAMSDEDILDKNNLILFYSGVSISNKWDSSVWNREHIWCKSLSGGLYTNVGEGTRNAGTDLHQLRPASTPVNTSRNNKPYAELYHTGTNVLYKEVETNNYSKDNLFEPRDEIKGDVARMLFYMYAHYSNEVATTNPSYSGAMKLENIVYTPVQSKEASAKVLLKWNESDPVDDFERRRNEYIASVQGNRNPFIDHPEFAGMIFDENYTGDGALIDQIGIYSPNNLCLSTYAQEIALGERYSLIGYTLPNKCDVSLSSANSNIVKIVDGALSAVGLGQTIISAKAEIGGNIYERECLINVIEKKKSTSVYKNKQYRYTISAYAAGSQYASNEKHVLDDNFTLYVDNGFFSTEIRMYASTKNDTTVYCDKLPAELSKIVLNAGYGVNTLTVLGSSNGINYSTVADLKIAKSNADYTVDFSNYDYKFFKLDATENSTQIRVNEISLYYKNDNIVEDKQYIAIDNINPKAINNDDETLQELVSFNNVIYDCKGVSTNENGQLVVDTDFVLENKTTYGIIDKIVIVSSGKFDVSFMDEFGGEVKDSVVDRSDSIAPVIDCGFFKILNNSGTNQTIDNILVYYNPIAALKYQVDDSNNWRVVAEIKDLRNGHIGFEIDGSKVFVEQVKKTIIANDTNRNTSELSDGYFFTYEIGSIDTSEHLVSAFVSVNKFQTIYLETRTISFTSN